ncbi:hypothetical protein [Pseudovibrio sp. Tun.PSC04-5.I4]|uniref:hypothetical protein n=1 Tax=Pseudovibrio sp. Tun.PSC04-5.I4 TaxID=1798213 RepID=UPI00088FC454|nr:hypothetical protein [Pseudovibrio sp. Tun.PSC04-5.I4]SDR08129.1 hypothetical protein SAMN04515695_2655 [Pseudovibrio sp. Tun.PSC04-5.I4]
MMQILPTDERVALMRMATDIVAASISKNADIANANSDSAEKKIKSLYKQMVELVVDEKPHLINDAEEAELAD